MNKDRHKIKLSNMLLDAAVNLKSFRLLDICNSMKKHIANCSNTAKESKLFVVSTTRNWFGSAEKVRTRISRNLYDFANHLNRFKDLINQDEIKLPKLSDIYADIVQLEKEYGDLKIDLEKKTISVISDYIELDEIPLGTFEVKLYIDKINNLYKEPPYRVIALEPNPAGTDCNVTHPHVSDDVLCEGDGYIPIRRAIEQGRIFDFFSLIDNILQNYNPDSPYVALDEWEGNSCYDCGNTLSYDESYYCERCDQYFRSHCSSYCQKCNTTICMGCSYQCPSCEEPVCNRCVAKCQECEEFFCIDCLNEEGLCSDCEEQRKEIENEEQENESDKPETVTEIQSDGMGKTIIHA